MFKQRKGFEQVRLSRPWRAVSLLFVYLLGGFEVLPTLLLWLAAFDGTHHSLVSVVDNKFNLLLSHRQMPAERTSNALDLVHRHGPAATWLCLLATASPFPSDHLVQLSGHLLMEEANGANKLTRPTQSEGATSPWFARLSPTVNYSSIRDSFSVHSCFVGSNSLACSRSVVLLI